MTHTEAPGSSMILPSAEPKSLHEVTVRSFDGDDSDCASDQSDGSKLSSAGGSDRARRQAHEQLSQIVADGAGETSQTCSCTQQTITALSILLLINDGLLRVNHETGSATVDQLLSQIPGTCAQHDTMTLESVITSLRTREQQSSGTVSVDNKTSPSCFADFGGHADATAAAAASEAADKTRLYPATIPPNRFHPCRRDFEVVDQGTIGRALLTYRGWKQGDFMARFDGLTVPDILLHTLQTSHNTHLWDPYFIGNLAHSCDPNVMLDMAEHEMWAIRDIQPGDVLSMDYASTEDHLFRTFKCACGAPGCRGEVTGRKQRRCMDSEAPVGTTCPRTVAA